MIPWVELASVDLGPVRLRPFFVFLITAVLLGYRAFLRGAGARGIEPKTAKGI